MQGDTIPLDLSGAHPIRLTAASLPGRKPPPCFRCRSSCTAPRIADVPNRRHSAPVPRLPVPAKRHHPLRCVLISRRVLSAIVRYSARFELTPSRPVRDPGEPMCRILEAEKPEWIAHHRRQKAGRKYRSPWQADWLASVPGDVRKPIRFAGVKTISGT